MTAALDQFLELCCAEIERRASTKTTAPWLSEGAAAFRQALATAVPLEVEQERQPVVDQLREVSSPLVDALRPAVDAFPWHAKPGHGDGGTELALGRIDQVRDLGMVNCGLMLIGAGCTYPLHDHPPQELYLPLTASGMWRVGGATNFRAYGPDELPYNNPLDVHSVKAAADEPLLAMFVLWP